MKLDWAAQRIAKQDGFVKAQTVLEIGGGSFARIASLARAYPNKIFFSVDMGYSSQSVRTVTANADLRNLNIVKVNANKPIFAENMFDFIFSSAVMEHIPNVNDFLLEMSRITRPGGEHFFIESPFWTSYKGHHYKHSDQRVVNILGGYKHIIYDANQMRDYLISLPQLHFDIEECVQRIYFRSDLSRLSRDETYQEILSSPFEIRNWIDIKDECFDQSAAHIASSNSKYSVRDFMNKGSIVSLIRN